MEIDKCRVGVTVEYDGNTAIIVPTTKNLRDLSEVNVMFLTGSIKTVPSAILRLVFNPYLS